jgi:inorganic pyrophosphatase
VEVEVVVEIARGSRNKYEIDHESGAIWLDRMLFTATQYPADYGFIAGTLGEDGDPLDALVLVDEATFPGCHILARPVAAFLMQDEAGRDAKVLCVPASDNRWDDTRELGDVRPSLLEEIGHFFEIYKALEPDKHTQVDGWVDRADAERLVVEARTRQAEGGGAHAGGADQLHGG